MFSSEYAIYATFFILKTLENKENVKNVKTWQEFLKTLKNVFYICELYYSLIWSRITGFPLEP